MQGRSIKLGELKKNLALLIVKQQNFLFGSNCTFRRFRPQTAGWNDLSYLTIQTFAFVIYIITWRQAFYTFSAKTSQKLMNLVYVSFVPIVTQYPPGSLEIDSYIGFKLIVVVTSQLVSYLESRRIFMPWHGSFLNNLLCFVNWYFRFTYSQTIQ